MSEMIDNVNITKQMRDINISDLLGRQQISFDDVLHVMLLSKRHDVVSAEYIVFDCLFRHGFHQRYVFV